jgi:hypothetical protein
MSDESPNPLVDEIRRAARPKRDLALPPRPDLPDIAVETRTREIGEKWGVATQMVSGAALPELEPIAPLISVRFDCPDYLDTAISVKAAEQNVTKTYLILKALKDGGFELRDVDLVVDRRKARKR